MLRTGQFDPESSGKAFETIERNARAQSQLIEDLLDVSRIITGKLRIDVRQVDPNSFVEAAVEAVRPAAEAKGIRLQKIMDTGMVSVSGDPVRLQQVVWNLLSNAIKFTPKQGRVQITTRPPRRASACIRRRETRCRSSSAWTGSTA
jgi:signal transduction histidine kinase